MLKKLNALLSRIKSPFSLNIVALIIVLFALFYWFQWRPAEIRKNCSNLDFKEIERVLGGKLNSTELSAGSINKLYKLCLARNGLKPEDITQ